MEVTTSCSKLTVLSAGRGVVGHAGTRLLADLAQATGLEAAFVDALAPLRQRSGGHAPGRVAVDLAVMLADGGEAISDLAVLREQAEVFGPLASAPTAWRVLDGIDAGAITRLRGARAVARTLAWAQHAETHGAFPQATAARRVIPGLVLDIDATIVICHSEKENATPTWKKSFGHHPLPCFLDNTGEAPAGILRPGRAGSNTAADHVEVLDAAQRVVPGDRSGRAGARGSGGRRDHRVDDRAANGRRYAATARLGSVEAPQRGATGTTSPEPGYLANEIAVP